MQVACDAMKENHIRTKQNYSQVAVQKPTGQAVQKLLDQSADPMAKDGRGNTPLSEAAVQGPRVG